MKTLVLLLSLISSIQVHAKCRPGDRARIISAGDRDWRGYVFESQGRLNGRVLPVGTELIVLDVSYITLSGMTFMDRLQADVRGATRNMIDPQTNEPLSCSPIIGEIGQFRPSAAGYFGMEFVSCQALTSAEREAEREAKRRRP